MEQQIETLDKKIDQLNQKFDLLTQRFDLLKLKFKDNETEWSIEEYKEAVLIKFSFNVKFKDAIKELGGKWMVSKKAWMFPKSRSEEVKCSLLKNFESWKFTIL